MLLKFAKDKGFEHLMKIEKGRLAGRLKTILVLVERYVTKISYPVTVTNAGACTWQVKFRLGTCDYTIVGEVQTCPI